MSRIAFHMLRLRALREAMEDQTLDPGPIYQAAREAKQYTDQLLAVLHDTIRTLDAFHGAPPLEGQGFEDVTDGAEALRPFHPLVHRYLYPLFELMEVFHHKDERLLRLRDRLDLLIDEVDRYAEDTYLTKAVLRFTEVPSNFIRAMSREIVAQSMWLERLLRKGSFDKSEFTEAFVMGFSRHGVFATLVSFYFGFASNKFYN
jgi:hypothetical protein